MKPIVLLILDGFGIGPNNTGNAIARAKKPNIDKYWKMFPHTQLAASGEAVGLPHGEDGNTETGHLNIGAGTIVYQDLPRVNMAIADKSFAKNKAFLDAFNFVKKNKSALHLMGLIGSGGVHSNIEHLYELLNLSKQNNVKEVYIHGFTDGRDSPPTSGLNYIKEVMDFCKKLGVGEISSITGRFYAMDRDRRWDRIEKTYDMLTLGTGIKAADPLLAIKEQYDKKITDEFIEPINICSENNNPRLIEDNDAVIFFNFRIDRPRELTRAFVLPDFEKGIKNESFDPYTIEYEHTHIQKKTQSQTFKRKKILKNLFFVTMTQYEENLPVAVAFPPELIKNPIGKVFADNNLKQLRMAETEKEKFVTFYMNGQQNVIFPKEDRLIIPSKGAKSYDQIPEMSAYEITKSMITEIKKDKYNAIICNFANADMVAHTGNLTASIKAVEVLDECIGKIVEEVLVKDGVVFITADHGNCEELINNKTGQIDTEHSIYPVPFIIIDKKYQNQNKFLPTGVLADVAPTILSIMGIKKPETMTGRPLLGDKLS